MDGTKAVEGLSWARYVRHYICYFIQSLKNVTDCLQFTEEKMRFQFAMSYNKGVAEPKLGIPDPLQDTQLGTLILMTHFPLEVNS